MKKVIPAANPDAYVEALSGWQSELVQTLRSIVVATAKPLDERIKWGHLVYFANGPAFLIRAEEQRVLFGFWRGQCLIDTEPRLKPGGKYEMATLVLLAGTLLAHATVVQLIDKAIALNQELGDPTALS